MKTAVLLNDTSYENHHGCSIVVDNIKENLRQKDIKLLATNPIGKNWQKNVDFMKALEACDIVLVNAEGTIHHNSTYGLNLLKIVDAVQKKPTVLMNMTYQSNSNLYVSLIKQFSKVYVRESISQDELYQAGIEADVVPDMTFYRTYPTVKERTDEIFVTDSHDIKKSEQLYVLAQKMNWKFFPILSPFTKVATLKGISKSIKYGFFQRYGSAISHFLPIKYAYMRYTNVLDECTYLSQMRSAKCLITARFHALCFAIQTQTPFIALSSNTHKVEGLLKDIGLDSKKIINWDHLDTIKDVECTLTSLELEKINHYIDQAKVKIDQMFNEIDSLILEN
jgi:polysaccharide pyruvyl transferase WcaK-like protein